MRRPSRRPSRAGFTLIEMMVALVIGAVSVVVAAKVAQVIVRQSAQGQQATDFAARSRLLARQLRADLRAAGYGSSGAIAVDSGAQPWAAMIIPTVNNKPAIPAVVGVNGLGAVSVGGVNTEAGSDAVMVVVPNGALKGVTQGWSRIGTTTIFLDTPPLNPVPGVQPLASCATGMIYVVDHTAPNGAGRVQVMNLTSVSGNVVTTADDLQFTLAPGSSVSCARMSTYWVDEDGWLHRTDFRSGVAPTVLAGQVYVDAGQVGNDLMAPGVIDLQIAYRFSSEVYFAANLTIPAAANLPAQWAYEGQAGNVDGMLTGAPQNWFEVRRVRINALMRTVREVEPRDYGQKDRLGREDGPQRQVDRPYRTEWVTIVEALTNLRYFDFGAPQGVPPEPF